MDNDRQYCDECECVIFDDGCACKAPALTQQGDVAIINWVAEWKAACGQIIDAIRETPLDELTLEQWEDAGLALRLVERIYDSKRRHSATK